MKILMLALFILMTSCDNTEKLIKKSQKCGCVSFSAKYDGLSLGNFVICEADSYNKKKDIEDVKTYLNCSTDD